MRLSRLAVLTAVAIFAIVPLAQALPTCTVVGTPADAATAPCGFRVIAPPLQSATFIDYDLDYKASLDAIEAINPRVMDVLTIGKSYSNRTIYAVRLTDETVTTPKRQVAISLSVHGNERAGREGGLRYVEDLVRWSKTDPKHALYTGDTAVALEDILRQTEIYVGIINVDGWVSGDLGAEQSLQRGNGRGVDLNRDFPTLGWSKRTQLSEPETRAWHSLVSAMPNLTTATDLHGELTTENGAFSDIMYPAGQWDPQEQAQELQLARNMKRSVERKFAEEGVVLQKVIEALPPSQQTQLRNQGVAVRPAEYATAYDVVGYDDSGFMGDWFVSEGAIEVDTENFLSHAAPNRAYVPILEQAHVAAIKGNMEAVIAESMITHLVKAEVNIGRVAYIDDPSALVSRDATAAAAGYDVDRLRYFGDLARDAGVQIDALSAADVPNLDLSGYDSIVLADTLVPADRAGRSVDTAAYLAALDTFAKNGGQLVLTDGAVGLLDDLGVVPAAAIKTARTNAGHVAFGAREHRWESGLHATSSQTYFEVPLGYTASNQAPHWGVDAAALNAAGGTAIGTMSTSTSTVTLAEIPRGSGSIAIFGAILPTQTQGNRHDFGLADYAPTVAGGQVLHAILAERR